MFYILIVSAASSGSGRLQIALNLDLRDGTEETAMGLALWTGQFDVARELLEAGTYVRKLRTFHRKTLP